MPFIPAPNVARVEIRFLWDNQRVENVLHFLKSSAIIAGDMEVLSAAVMNHWITNILPLQVDEVELREVVARDLTSATGFEGSATPLAATFGGYAANAMPNNVTIAVSLRTGLSGRSQRGRVYWIGMTEDSIVNNQVDASMADDIVDAFNSMVGPAAVLANWTWVVTSFRTGGNDRTSAQSLTITDVLIVDRIIDSQRRRLPGRGR